MANKRPKLHPLRQTSFPANVEQAAYASAIDSARSETGSVANSTFSKASKAQPRGRGRPRKSLQITEDDARSARDGGSTTGKPSQAKSTISMAKSGVDDEPDEDEEEEIEVHGEDDADHDVEEQVRVNRLVAQMPEIHSQKYNEFKSAKLKEAVVKRIINQTVSQSVTAQAVHAAQYATKAFAVEIIERARQVQEEYARAADVGIQRAKQARLTKAAEKERDLADREKTAAAKDPPTRLSELEKRIAQEEIQKLKREAESYAPDKHKGGLLPDHIREALRRYKHDGDGGGFGFSGHSHALLATKGSNTWRIGDGGTGQRLFR